MNEKNKTTMTNALVQKVANYSVSYAAVWYFIKSDCDSCLEGIYEGFSPDEMNKDPRKRKPSKYTTGFKGKDDPFKELTQAYRRERKDTTENKKEGTTRIRQARSDRIISTSTRTPISWWACTTG
ncbi:MAG: hypothetical protein IPI55_02285 [Flavobacteriales bacterium]|nr:hypothetical protein [Flavobacteriales bacterium]